MEEMQQHQGEWFFLHELNVDKVFSTIQRAIISSCIISRVAQETRPGEKNSILPTLPPPRGCG